VRAGRALLQALLVQALVVASGARAEDVCRPAYRAGAAVWYGVETRSREARISDSGCAGAAGARGAVAFFVQAGRVVIACDLPLEPPAAMKAELAEAQRQDAAGLPSHRRKVDGLWTALVHRYASALTCAPGFERMSDTGSDLPTVWCRRHLSARELCPHPGTTFADGACYDMACPVGTEDLDASTGGRLSGCSRCPAGRLDVAESLAWRERLSGAPSTEWPAAAVLCKARASDACPDAP
jgi:hypothetical protein